MTFPTTVLQVLIELFISGAWADVTADVYLRDPITIERGRKDEGAKTDTSKCKMQFNNGQSNINPAVVGRYSPRNPASDLFGLLGRNTPIRITVTTPSGATSVRFAGEVPEWPSRWEVSGNDVWVPVEAAGVMRRLSQGTPPARSALRRLIDAYPPSDYWPLTDGEDAIQGQPAAGANPMRSVSLSGTLYEGQPNWGRGSLAAWLEPVVELPAEDAFGRLSAVPALLDVTGGWSVDYCIAGVGGSNSMRVADGGTGTTADPIREWAVEANPGSGDLAVTLWTYELNVGSGVGLASVSAPQLYDGAPHHIRLAVTPIGGTDADFVLWVDGVEVAADTAGVHAGRPPVKIVYEWLQGDDPASSLGHVVYWTDPPAAAEMYRALVGYRGELAGRRVERVCAEEGLALAVAGDLDDTQPMGPQRPGGVLDVMEAAAAVDGGVLGEARDVLGLAYRTGRSKYNQGV